MSNGPKFTKIVSVIAIALLAIILMTSFTQGCGTRYVDPEKLKEVVTRWLNLDVELQQLENEADEQRNALAAMQDQANNLQVAIEVAQGDTASAKDEATDLQKDITDKQGEIDNIEDKMEEVQNELEEIEQMFATLGEFSAGEGPCFACDTLVLMADNSLKRISEVQVGDMVQAYNVHTGQTVIADVTATNSGEADYYYLINGNLKVTPPHPFFTAEGKWVKIADLEVGDKIRGFQGLVEITSIEKVNSGQRICNISVRNFHNFFVSANGKDFYLVQE